MNKNVAVAVVVLMVGACSPAPEGPSGGGGGTAATGGSTGTGGSGGGTAVTGGGSQSGGGTGAGTQGGGAGGGTTASRSDELTAGTRLKVRAVVGVDGSRQQLGFFDSMRMENCSFYPATDGTQRCMPFESVAGEGYFSDAQCMQRLFIVAPGCTTQPKYGVRYLTTTCPFAYELHSLGAVVTPAQVFGLSGTSCVAVTPTAGFRLFPSTGQLSPALFVQGDVVIEP